MYILLYDTKYYQLQRRIVHGIRLFNIKICLMIYRYVLNVKWPSTSYVVFILNSMKTNKKLIDMRLKKLPIFGRYVPLILRRFYAPYVITILHNV